MALDNTFLVPHIFTDERSFPPSTMETKVQKEYSTAKYTADLNYDANNLQI